MQIDPLKWHILSGIIVEVNQLIVFLRLALMYFVLYIETEPNQLTMPCIVNIEQKWRSI